MKKEYSKPSLFIESFQPQEYCSICEYYVSGVDPDNEATIESHYKFWVDSGQDGKINGTDFDHSYVHQTDGAGWGHADTYVWAWWASDNNVAKDILKAEDPYTEFLTQQGQGHAGYVEAVLNPSNNHYHAGKVTMSRNHS